MAVTAILARRHMTTQRRRAATFDGRHHLQLAEAQMAGPGLAPSGAVVTKDIRDLQPFTMHGARLYEPFLFFPLAPSSSSGLLTARKVELSTRA